MKLLKLSTIFLLALTASPITHASDQETQYVCSFQSKIQMTNISPSSPSAETKEDKGRYTFFDNGTNRGAYISLSFGVKRPAIVIRNNGFIVFVEDLGGSPTNHFVMTVFTSERYEAQYLAVMSFHSVSKAEFFRPSQAIGECARI